MGEGQYMEEQAMCEAIAHERTCNRGHDIYDNRFKHECADMKAVREQCLKGEKWPWSIAALIRYGYRRTSRAHGIVSRIDRKDWKEISRKRGCPVDADWYRRCISPDNLTIPLSIIRYIPTSGHDPVGYVPAPWDEVK